ncbi:hypothetical protein [Candidatus Leptofilum sp.]|uniref:hypothetical protein n=1 Tax=Candidatus Leptofilum sp. TaxID=3241576 RepID=UPI003B5931F2
MTIIMTFTTLSFVASAFIVSACALSSRMSQREGLKECYAEYAESTQVPAKSVTPFSVN